MKSSEIRKKFFDFFVSKSHTRVDSSPVIPAQDPSLLFTNAGMNQFKDVFLGLEKRTYTCAVSIQKCIRAGGKHNDLDNVGFTKRHLTFFEMMGNFSFGDYFKKEAILFAWEFLTKHMALPAHTLYASVYKTDDESFAMWRDVIGLPTERIYRLGEAENFWQMGDTGPCGPCTEIHIDRGAYFGCADLAMCGPACDCDRFLEIWNLVFMQYDRQPDGTDKPLRQKGVDTGMGFERLCAVVQEKESVFQIDLFQPLLEAIEKISGIVYEQQEPLLKNSFHVLADHIRSASFIIADGVAPSNEGRGYVLRKIIRRAALFAKKLGNPMIFAELSSHFIAQMSSVYPELIENKKIIFTILSSEIKKFSQNLDRGQAMLASYVQQHKNEKIVSGEYAFKLYDTFGFPLELLHVMAKEAGFSVDKDQLKQFMKKQQEQSGKKEEDELMHVDLGDFRTEFTGYHELETPSVVKALIVGNHLVEQVSADEKCWVIVEKSPFFIVGGGQVPDQGWLVIGDCRVPLHEVRFIGRAIGVRITAPRDIHLGDAVTSVVDPIWRSRAMKNHTATHLLQAALIELFGKQIKQSGSLVHPDYLRFDFTYHQNLTHDDIVRIEQLVNEKIRENIPVDIVYTDLKNALAQGALAFFGDKYNPENVRMVKVADFSTELCGGTHVPATGAIGTFKITDVMALSAGHRRIVAVTGPRAIEIFQEVFGIVKDLSIAFKVKKEDVPDAVLKQKEMLRQAEQQIKALKRQLRHAMVDTWLEQLERVHDIPFLCALIPDADHQELKELAQQLEGKVPGVYCLVSTKNEKSAFLVYVSPTFGDRISLKAIGTLLAQEYGLRGGGTCNHLQGGGPIVNIQKVAASIRNLLAQES